MKRNLIALGLLCAVFGCQNDKTENQSQSGSLASADLTQNDTSAVLKIIKTADMNFRVKNVQATKIALAKNIIASGGQMVGFEIRSEV
ncbi:hypothetical protein ACVWYG_001814 [Pedobacter sp. UYEF25]